MLGRIKTSKNGNPIPLEWSESVARLLNESYKSQCEKEQRYFDVYGQVFSQELLLIVSYLPEKDNSLAPYTLFLSAGAEQISSEEKVKETQKNFIDITGLFFDEVFASSEWNEFEPNWQEITHNKETYFYKMSRENINATLEADRLLGPDFEDIELEQDH
jgi:hypothetical protein